MAITKKGKNNLDVFYKLRSCKNIQIVKKPKLTLNSMSLSLNFLRNKFFPSINLLTSNFSKESTVLMSLSLGLINKNFSYQRSQKVSKQSYLRLASFLKRSLMFLGSINVSITVKGVPKFVKELLNTIFNKSDKILRDPFDDTKTIDSFSKKAQVSFSKVYFTKPYDYSDLKVKKKGKPKRKIVKKIVKLNNIID